jgi:hypothetical protein
MLQIDGLQRAADIVEDTLKVGLRGSPSATREPVVAVRLPLASAEE